MVNILLQGLDDKTRMELLPREQEIVKELEADGSIQHNFIKLDMSGIYMVMVGEDANDVDAKLARLPYYPYMKIEIVPVRFVNNINQ